MTRDKHYPKAPIVEAVIDLKCEFPIEQSAELLAEMQVLLSNEYPVREEQIELSAQIAPTTGITSAQRVTGFRLLTAERSRIAGIGIEGFAFSWLAPYARWEALRDEAFRIWTLYRSITNPLAVSRVGVRFINRLNLPCAVGGGVNLDEYLRTAPRIAPELPQTLDSFFLRFQIVPAGHPPSGLTITETSVASVSPDFVSVVLDIDAFANGLSATSDEAWEIIERLREHKNLAFESCITDMTRELLL